MVVTTARSGFILAGVSGALDIHRLTSGCPIQKTGYGFVPVSFRFSAGVSPPAQGVDARQQNG